MRLFTRIGNWRKKMAVSLLRGRIHAHLQREQHVPVRDLALRALVLHREFGEDEEFSEMVRTVAAASYFLGEYRTALRYGWVAFRCDRRRGDRRAMCQSSAVIAGATLRLSDLPRALTRAEKALALARELGHPDAIAAGLGNLSQVFAALRRISCGGMREGVAPNHEQRLDAVVDLEQARDGLSRAFMLAGVPSVIASLWKIPDGPTETLMTHFYDHLNEGKARALCQATRKTIADGFRDPREWAGFILIGRHR